METIKEFLDSNKKFVLVIKMVKAIYLFVITMKNR